MFGLDLLACQTPGYIACDLTLHVVPPLVAPQVLVHLGAARVNEISAVMRIY